MIPNNHPHHHRRLEQLILAIKLVYASTYSEASRAFAQSTSHRIEDEKMAVVIQRLTGSIHGDYYYPAISGVAQSYNFYPIAHLQPDDGIAHIALGLGKTVVEGGTTLRFSPRHPQHLPQLSTVDDILKNSQKNFFALKMSTSPNELALKEDATLAKLDIGEAFCYSTMALGNGRTDDIKDIVYVNPHAFDPARTMDIAAEVGRFNHALFKKNRKYLLIGPGRWGTADPWLGIPVKWKDISGVGAIIETAAQNLKVDPSQGSHFFHNITSLGISYFTTSQNKADFIDWKWLQSLPAAKETTYLKHVKHTKPLAIRIDGKKSRGIILA